jgi:hypothetical protein
MGLQSSYTNLKTFEFCPFDSDVKIVVIPGLDSPGKHVANFSVQREENGGGGGRENCVGKPKRTWL